MITPETMVWLVIGYLFLEGFCSILAGAFRTAKRQEHDEKDVIIGIIIVIIALILLLI